MNTVSPGLMATPRPPGQPEPQHHSLVSTLVGRRGAPEDVAAAVVRVLQGPAAHPLYELAGPRVYTYKELLRVIAAATGSRPFLIPVAFRLWHAIGFVSEILPRPPVTRNQVELMEQDNVPEPDAPGFESLHIIPRPIENILAQILRAANRNAER